MKGSKHLHTPACTAILVFTGFLAIPREFVENVGTRAKKKREMTGEGEGREGFLFSLPLPFHFLLLPLQLSRYNSTGKACYADYRAPCSASLFCMIDLTHLMLRHRPLSFSRKFDGFILVVLYQPIILKRSGVACKLLMIFE